MITDKAKEKRVQEETKFKTSTTREMEVGRDDPTETETTVDATDRMEGVIQTEREDQGIDETKTGGGSKVEMMEGGVMMRPLEDGRWGRVEKTTPPKSSLEGDIERGVIDAEEREEVREPSSDVVTLLRACHWMENTSDHPSGLAPTNGLGLLVEMLLDAWTLAAASARVASVRRIICVRSVRRVVRCSRRSSWDCTVT